MVGAHLSMPDMLDGCAILAQAEMRGVRKVCGPGAQSQKHLV